MDKGEKLIFAYSGAIGQIYPPHPPEADSNQDPRLILYNYMYYSRSFNKLIKSLEAIELMLSASWSASALDTLKIIFHIRDCRGGPGRSDFFKVCVAWLLKHHINDLIVNMRHIPHYGSYKDLLFFLDCQDLENIALNLFAEQLRSDILLVGTIHANKISLAAKYAPTEGGHHDKNYNAVAKLASRLGCTKQDYRKKYLVPLRRELNIIDHLMTNDDKSWNMIDIPKLPRAAFDKYSKAISKHTHQSIEELQSQRKNSSYVTIKPENSNLKKVVTVLYDLLKIIHSSRYDRILITPNRLKNINTDK
jgi:hypothetical protein